MLCSPELKMLKNKLPNDELFDRLVSYWTMLGGIPAFVGTFGFATLTSTGAGLEVTLTELNSCFHAPSCRNPALGILLFLSGACGYLSAIFAGVFFQALNSSSPNAVAKWMTKFIGLLWLPMGNLAASVATLGISLLIISGDLYGAGVTSALGVAFGVLFLFLVLLYLQLHSKSHIK